MVLSPSFLALRQLPHRSCPILYLFLASCPCFGGRLRPATQASAPLRTGSYSVLPVYGLDPQLYELRNRYRGVGDPTIAMRPCSKITPVRLPAPPRKPCASRPGRRSGLPARRGPPGTLARLNSITPNRLTCCPATGEIPAIAAMACWSPAARFGSGTRQSSAVLE